MNGKQRIQRQLGESFEQWLKAPSEPRWALGVAAALRSVQAFEIPSLLKKLRTRLWWSTLAFRPRDPEAWPPVLGALLAATPAPERPWLSLALCAHPNGYARQGVVAFLDPNTESGTVGLCHLSDDPVLQVWRVAQSRLLGCGPRELALCLPLLRRPADLEHRRAWRQWALARLAEDDARGPLRERMMRGEGAAAVDAWTLLLGRTEASALGPCHAAVCWRVRVLSARRAVVGGDVEAAHLFLRDVRVAVRYAVAWEAARQESPLRERILEAGLFDSSTRVLRIVFAYLPGRPGVQERAQELLRSVRVRERVSGVRLVHVLPVEHAKRALEETLRDPSPSVRAWTFRILAEQDWLQLRHMEVLAAEPHPRVLAQASEHIAARGRYRASLMALLERPLFLSTAGPASVLAQVPIWARLPWVLRALAEAWPSATSLQERALSELRARSVKAWLGPSPAEVDRIRAALSRLGPALPASGQPLLQALAWHLSHPEAIDSEQGRSGL